MKDIYINYRVNKICFVDYNKLELYILILVNK